MGSSILILMLQGCIFVGGAVVGTVHSTVDDPVLSKTKGQLKRAPRDLTKTSYLTTISRDVVRKYWGAPDEIHVISKGIEKWEYDLGLRWNGIILIPLVPIPLFIPVGYEHVDLTFENHILTSADMYTERFLGGAGCGASGIMHAQFPPYL